MKKSLELNWIRNFDKSLVIPEVVYSNVNAGGCYTSPVNNTIVIDDKEYDCRYGIIEVSIDHPEYADAILAHEWRHHWQACHGWNHEYKYKWNHDNYDDDYDVYCNAVIQYLTLNPQELDAIRFQYKYSRLYEEWEGLLENYL